MSVIECWQIRTQFVGDDGYTHETRVEGPPTPGYEFLAVVKGSDYDDLAEQLRGAVEALAELLAALDDAPVLPNDPTWAAIVKARGTLRDLRGQ